MATFGRSSAYRFRGFQPYSHPVPFDQRRPYRASAADVMSGYAPMQTFQPNLTRYQAKYPPLLAGATQPATQPAAQQGGGQQPAPGQQAGPPGFDAASFESDPVYQRTKALTEQMVQQAEASALAGKKQTLIDFGSGDLVTKLLGGGESATATAAAQNPFSTLANLLNQHQTSTLGIDEGRNKQNLFYSSTRAKDLTDEQKAYLQAQTQAQSDVDSRIQAFQNAVLDAKNQASQQLLAAEEGAYGRALQMWLARAGSYTPPDQGGGGDGGQGGGGDGGGSGGQPPDWWTAWQQYRGGHSGL